MVSIRAASFETPQINDASATHRSVSFDGREKGNRVGSMEYNMTVGFDFFGTAALSGEKMLIDHNTDRTAFGVNVPRKMAFAMWLQAKRMKFAW